MKPAVLLVALVFLLSTACQDTVPSPANNGDPAEPNQYAPDAGDGDVDSDADTDNDSDNDSDNDNDNEEPSACALPTPFDVGLQYERDLFVAPNGDNTFGDGSADNPFATLQAAAGAATPGTRIVLREGTYAGGIGIYQLRGEPGRPIAVVADGEVIIDGGGTGLQFIEPHHLVVDGLIVENATHNGLSIDDGGTLDTPAEHIVLRNLTVRNIGTGGNHDCIKLSGLRHFFVLDSDVSGCRSGEMVDMVGCHEGLISGNRFADSPGVGVQAKGGSADVLIHGNRFERIAGRAVNAGGSTGLAYFRPQDAPHEAARIDVVANLFVEVGETSGAPIAYVGCDACTFAHNTVIRPQTWVARILQESTAERFVPSRDGRFINNIIALNVDDLRHGVYVNYSGGTDLESFFFGHNLWFALDRGNDYAGPTYSGGIPAEQNPVIQQDPLFVDAGNGDYGLREQSPADGIALSEILPFSFPDLDGHCYDNDAPTAGAFSL